MLASIVAFVETSASVGTVPFSLNACCAALRPTQRLEHVSCESEKSPIFFMAMMLSSMVRSE